MLDRKIYRTFVCCRTIVRLIFNVSARESTKSYIEVPNVYLSLQLTVDTIHPSTGCLDGGGNISLLTANISDFDGQLSLECIGLCLLDVPASIIVHLSGKAAKSILSKIEHIALSLIVCWRHGEVLHKHGCGGFAAYCIVES